MNTAKKPQKQPSIDPVNEEFFQVGQQEVRACWSDTSEGGIFVQTMTPLPFGDKVMAKIRFEADQTLYLNVGIVRHSLSSVGKGIEFTHVHPNAKRLIAALATGWEEAFQKRPRPWNLGNSAQFQNPIMEIERLVAASRGRIGEWKSKSDLLFFSGQGGIGLRQR